MSHRTLDPRNLDDVRQFALWALANVEMPDALRRDIVDWLCSPNTFKFKARSVYGFTIVNDPASHVQAVMFWASWGDITVCSSNLRKANSFLSKYATYKPIELP